MKEIDSGAILLQEKVDIETQDTAGSLHDKLAKKENELICNTIRGILKGSITPKNKN